MCFLRKESVEHYYAQVTSVAVEELCGALQQGIACAKGASKSKLCSVKMERGERYLSCVRDLIVLFKLNDAKVGKESLENSEILDFILIENIDSFYSIVWKEGQEFLPAWEANWKDRWGKTVSDVLCNAGAYPQIVSQCDGMTGFDYVVLGYIVEEFGKRCMQNKHKRFLDSESFVTSRKRRVRFASRA